MDEMLNIADLAICRSGAMTVTEISTVGKPAIFIPLPSKMANRQEDNALVLKNIGAAEMILNDRVNYQNLSETINKLINDKVLLNNMGKKAESLAPKDVLEKIYEEIKKVISWFLLKYGLKYYEVNFWSGGKFMPSKKRNSKEKRKRLNSIAKKVEEKIEVEKDDVVTEGELKEASKVVSSRIVDNFFIVNRDDMDIIKSEKSLLQRELDNIKNPEIKEMPEFLKNPEMSEERIATMDKINTLLKHRFSLVTIADILECNDYDRLDEIIEQKDKMYKLTEKYSTDAGLKPIRLFSGLKKTVGDEYSRTYHEQEERMKAAIKNISEGRYFKSKVEPETMIEDIVSKVIDHPDFNLACQIETQFKAHELDRAIAILSDLNSRSELQSLIDDLRKTYIEISGRSHAFEVMDKIITGASNRNIIEDKNSDEER